MWQVVLFVHFLARLAPIFALELRALGHDSAADVCLLEHYDERNNARLAFAHLELLDGLVDFRIDLRLQHEDVLGQKLHVDEALSDERKIRRDRLSQWRRFVAQRFHSLPNILFRLAETQANVRFCGKESFYVWKNNFFD